MRTLISLCLVLLTSTTLSAQGIGLFARAGTGGIGAGVAYGVSPSLNVRAEASYFTYSADDIELDMDYDAGVNAEGTLLLGSVLADWHPGAGSFHLTFGAVYNASELSGTIVPLEPIVVGSRSYSPVHSTMARA